jgi:hypothetical protein
MADKPHTMTPARTIEHPSITADGPILLSIDQTHPSQPGHAPLGDMGFDVTMIWTHQNAPGEPPPEPRLPQQIFKLYGEEIDEETATAYRAAITATMKRWPAVLEMRAKRAAAEAAAKNNP